MTFPAQGQTVSANAPGGPLGRLGQKKGPAVKKPMGNPRGARLALLAGMQGPMRPGG